MKRHIGFSVVLALTGSIFVVACGDAFSTCRETHTCPRTPDAGAGGLSGDGGVATVGGGSGAGEDAGPGSLAEPLVIVTESLPDATFERSYEQALVVRGGTGAYGWSVTAGLLPPGLDLTDDGIVTGEPLEDGEYTFEVTVKDEGGSAVTQGLALGVIRKRWLVYRSDESIASQERLYAVDVVRGFAKSMLTSFLGPDGDADAAWWSPDGAWLAYTVTTTADPESMELRLVDMRQESPGSSLVVAESVTIGSNDLQWAPDGKRLAYLERNATDEFDLTYVDFSSGEPAIPIRVGTAERYGWAWVGDLILASRSTEGLAFYAREGASWSDARSLAVVVEGGSGLQQGRFLVVDHHRSSAWFGESFSDCTGSFALVGFSPPSFEVTTLDLSANAQVDLFAGFDVGLNELVVRDAVHLSSGETLANLGPTTNCEMRAWAPDGRLLATISDADRLVLSRVGTDGTVEAVEVPGSYPSLERARFSANGATIVLTSGPDLFMSRIVDGRPTELVRVTGALSSGSSATHYSVAPDGSGVAYVAEQDAAGIEEAFVVTTPGAWRKVGPAIAPGGAASELTWSSDATHISFKSRVATGSPRRLYAINVTSLSSKAQDLTPGLECVGETCETVSNVQFQP